MEKENDRNELVENDILSSNEARSILCSIFDETKQELIKKLMRLSDDQHNQTKQAEEERKRLKQKLEATHKKKQDCYTKLEELRKELNTLKSKREEILREKEMTTRKVQAITEQISNLTNQSEPDANVIANEVRLYKDVLGLEVKKFKPGTLTFTFRYIFQNNPDKECCFDLASPDNEYQITHCQPEIPDASDHVTSLNETNDLGDFVSKMRNSFKKLDDSL